MVADDSVGKESACSVDPLENFDGIWSLNYLDDAEETLQRTFFFIVPYAEISRERAGEPFIPYWELEEIRRKKPF